MRSSSSAGIWYYAATLAQHALRGRAQRPRRELSGAHRHGTSRRRRNHHALELPAADRLPEASLRPRGRLHRGGQAQRPDPRDHHPLGPDPARGGPAGRRRQPGARRGRRRRLAVWSPRHPDDHVHRLHQRRPHGRRRGRPSTQEGQPRTRRKEPAGDLPRRRPRRRPGEGGLRRLLQPGRMLQRRLTAAGARRHRRGVHRQDGRSAPTTYGSATRSTPTPRSAP